MIKLPKHTLKISKYLIKGQPLALARWLSWMDGHPVNGKFWGAFLRQDTRLCMGLVPSWGASERQLIDVSLPLSLSLSHPSPLSKINKHVLR